MTDVQVSIAPRARPVGRPLGDIARAVLGALAHRPMTARELALALRCSLPVMMKTCERLRESGRIHCIARIRPAGSNRRAAVYHLTRPRPGGPRG